MIAALALAAILAAAPPTAVPAAGPPAAAAVQGVRFDKLSIPDSQGAPIEVGVWRPDGPAVAGQRLIVISHGTGGDFRGHEDTARALAGAGFVVASLTHTGDNWRDSSRAADIIDRPRQLHVLIDYMLADWEGHAGLDQARVGAFGFSAGGFTVLAAAGGKPDLSRLGEHCKAHPGFFDCLLLKTNPPTMMAGSGRPRAWVHDPRIKAVVSAAPALGFTFGREGLKDVRQPLQLWRAGADQILPSPFYAEAVRDALPSPPDYRVAEGAGHFDFLQPCSARLVAAAPAICEPTPGFDRAAFHEQLNREVVAFFKRKL